eukprot:scaffold129877_cov30-Phaeocystis_antarctica.AAC.1
MLRTRPEAKLAGSKMPRLGTLSAISTTGLADVWGQFERQTELRLPPSAVRAAPATTAEPNTSIGALGVGWRPTGKGTRYDAHRYKN